MKSLLSELKEIEYLNDFLKSFFIATGLYAEAVTREGDTLHSLKEISRCEFCEIVRQIPGGVKRCKESYRQAAIESAKWKEPYFFRCHAGLVMWAVPIIIWGEALGAIICGQVLLWKPDDFFWQEQELYHSKYKQFDKLVVAVQKLEVVSAERSQAAADLLFIVVNHLVARNIRVLEDLDQANKLQQKLRLKLENYNVTDNKDSINYDSYLKKEQILLNHIRLGDKKSTEATLIGMFADLFALTKGKAEEINKRIFELCCVVSRAAVEGGVDTERAMSILDNYNTDLKEIELIFQQSNKIIGSYIDDIFAFSDRKHVGMVKKAREYILENYSRQIKVEDVAASLYISSSHLSRLFRQELNCTVLEYLTRVRIEKALSLLKNNENSIQEVSKIVGFKYPSYFVRLFKQYTGITPLAYRNKFY